jgi:hypothetical protein
VTRAVAADEVSVQKHLPSNVARFEQLMYLSLGLALVETMLELNQIFAAARAGLAGKLMHDFRRTAVRNLERGGVSRSAAMKITGHKTESVYRRYAMVNEADMREAAVKLAALHAGEDRSHAMTPGQIERLAKAAPKDFSPSFLRRVSKEDRKA